MPFDPQTKGGVERSVAIAKANLVPTDINLLDEYASFADLEAACKRFTTEVNEGPHSVARRAPVEMLQEEQTVLHRVPTHPYTVTLGLARKVPANTPMVSFEHAQYSVPYTLLGQTVWVRKQIITGHEMIVISHVSDTGPTEVARHTPTTAGKPAIIDTHFPSATGDTVLSRSIRPVTKVETEFVELGDGARAWLRAATSQGVARITYKMGVALTLAKATTGDTMDRVLELGANFHRFQAEDFDSILASLRAAPSEGDPHVTVEAASSLAQGTTSWEGFGIDTPSEVAA